MGDKGLALKSEMVELLKNRLEKIRQLDDRHRQINEIIIDAIFKYSGVKIKAGDFTWRGRALFLKITPLKKSEIFLKQKLILRDLEKSLGKISPRRLI